MSALSKVEIQQKLSAMPHWAQVGKSIVKKYTFKSFVPAIAFVNKIADAAEKAALIVDKSGRVRALVDERAIQRGRLSQRLCEIEIAVDCERTELEVGTKRQVIRSR